MKACCAPLLPFSPYSLTSYLSNPPPPSCRRCAFAPSVALLALVNEEADRFPPRHRPSPLISCRASPPRARPPSRAAVVLTLGCCPVDVADVIDSVSQCRAVNCVAPGLLNHLSAPQHIRYLPWLYCLSSAMFLPPLELGRSDRAGRPEAQAQLRLRYWNTARKNSLCWREFSLSSKIARSEGGIARYPSITSSLCSISSTECASAEW